MAEYPHVRAAFINAIAEEGTKEEAVGYLQKYWNENCALRAEIERLKSESDARLREIQIAWNDRDAEKRRANKAEAERDEATGTIERLNSNNLTLCAELAGWKQSARQMEAERDEALAQVAAAFKLAENEVDQVVAIWEAVIAIRALTPADAKAALEAYGREKVQEGMQRALTMTLGHGLSKQAHDAILAEMNK